MTNDLHSLIAPYALDALDDLERARFEAHLAQCTSCQSELAGFVATAMRLGEAEELAPPTGLRDRLMVEVSTTRQERPTVTAVAKPGALRRTLPRLAIAAAFLVGAVGVGGYVNEHNQATDLRADRAAISKIVSASDARTTNKTYDGGGHVRLISSDLVDGAYIVASDMPSPGDGKVYQVWVVKDDSPVSEGVFTTEGSMVMKDLNGADRIAITVEPKGGSKQPTTPPITTLAV